MRTFSSSGCSLVSLTPSFLNVGKDKEREKEKLGHLTIFYKKTLKLIVQQHI